MYGYAGKILEFDLTNGGASTSELSTLGLKYLGGSGFCARLLYDRIKPGEDAYSQSNVLVLAPGLLTGMFTPTGSKTVFASKSPLTNSFCESSMGGPIGAELKHAGYDALVITGKAEKPSCLLIKDDEVETIPAGDLWGKSTRESNRTLAREQDVIAASIGVAGEKLVRFAGIDCEERQAGRGGLGAVMGSKNLKAIGVRGSKDISVRKPRELLELSKNWYDKMVESAAFQEDTKYGTGEFMDWINKERGVFPTNNWQLSIFENRKNIDPYQWVSIYSKKNKACYSCVKPCGRLFTIDEGKFKGTAFDGIEYETLYSLGSVVGNPDVEVLAKGNEMCDLFGMDTISTGGVIGFAMELYERGLLTKAETDGLDLRFGNSEILPTLIEKIALRDGLGDMMADGVRILAQKVGQGAENYAMHVKGMEPPAYDVRGIKGLALGFMTSPRGACHLRSCAYALELTGKFWRFTNVDRFSTKAKGQEIKDLEDLMTVYDSLGICKFSRGFFLASGFEEIMDCVDGRRLDEDALLKIGERINNLKHLFNIREGVTMENFLLPPRLTSEPIADGPAKGHYVSDEEMKSMLVDYFRARDWDVDGAIPKTKLVELELAR
jgi:aldehyde:ferredoxin oxidoreductase